MCKARRLLFVRQSDCLLIGRILDDPGDARPVGALKLEFKLAVNFSDIFPLDINIAKRVSAYAQNAMLELLDFSRNAIAI